MTQTAIGSVTVDHRVHVACGNAENRFGLPRRIKSSLLLQSGWAMIDTKALRFKHTTANRHPKAGVIDIRVASNQNDVAAIPAKLIHLFTRHRQKRCRSKTGGPVLRPGEQVAIRLDQEIELILLPEMIKNNQRPGIISRNEEKSKSIPYSPSRASMAITVPD